MHLGRLDIQTSSMGRKYITMGCVIVLVICQVVSFTPFLLPTINVAAPLSVTHGLTEFVICRRLHRVLVSVHFILTNKPPAQNIAKLEFKRLPLLQWALHDVLCIGASVVYVLLSRIPTLYSLADLLIRDIHNSSAFTYPR